MSLVSKSTQFYSGFDPRSIGSCAVWLDAADNNSFVLSGNSVTQWNDKSGNNRHASGGVSPTKSGNGVVFNGTNQYLTMSYLDSLTSPRNRGEITYVVANFTGVSALRDHAILGTPTTLTDRRYIRINRTSTGQTFRSGVSATFSSNGITSNVLTCMAGVFEERGGSALLLSSVNGSYVTSNTTATVATGTVNATLGATGSPLSNYFGGTIHELLLFSDMLPLRDRYLVEGYLCHKWGITISLVSHPYRRGGPILARELYLPLEHPSGGQCSLWLDATDSNSLEMSGGSVTRWLDKSGYGFHASNGVSPTYNGSNGVVFNGTSQFLTLPFGSDASVDIGETWFIIASHSQTAVGNYYIIGPTVTGGRGYVVNVTATTRAVRWDSNAQGRGDTFGVPVGTQFLTTGVFMSNTQWRTSLNGSALTAGAALGTFVAGGTTNLGRGVSSGFFGGTIHEVIRFSGLSNRLNLLDTYITSNQTSRIQCYLAKKWGLVSSTPATHPVRTIGTFGAVRFNPLSIVRWNGMTLPTYCKTWFDAADRSTITLTGTTVTGWTDKAGGLGAPIRVGSPQYIQSPLLNNLNCVSFSSSSSFYWSLFSQAQAFTMFVVTAQLSAVSDVYSFILEPNTSTAPVILFAPNPNPPGVLVIASGGTQLARNPPVEYYSGIAGVVTAMFNGSSSVIGWNGTFTTGTVGAGTWNGLYMGRDWSGAFVDQLVGEVICYATTLPISQRQQVEGYLAWKWGFQTQLPNNHPYRTVKVF
jgi:hypothetical protein